MKNKRKIKGWYILIATMSILFIACVVMQMRPITRASIRLYGVKDIKVHKLTDNGQVNDFKVARLVLMNGEVINNPTKADIVERRLGTYRTGEEFARITEFEEGMLN
ncbi:hypothetical protein FACS1894194_0770 [Bacilli bacterium]|nr:hypothetical protein FACS1894194_0770 [Bacilli bacterium]